MTFAEWAGDLPLAMTVESAERVAAMFNDIEALAMRKGQKPDGVRCMEVRDGIADIAIRGPISRYETFWSWLMGGVSTEMIGRAVAMAKDDPEIGGIVLHIDSPGGHGTGIGELAGYIRETAKVKPVVAYVEGYGASAAYWLASAASEVIVDPSAMVGSIGTIIRMDGRSRQGELTFVSSQSPRKVVNPNTPEGAAQVQSWLDSLSEVFIKDVARYRGVTPKKVASDFGKGDLLVGKAAVEAGAADRVGNYEMAVKRARDTRKTLGKGRKPAVSGGSHKGKPMSLNPFAVLARIWGSNPEAVQEALNADAAGATFATLATGPAVSADKIRDEAKAEAKAETDRLIAEAKAEADRRVAEAATVARAEAKAAAWADASLRGEKITPAEAESFAVLAAALAIDDAKNPIQKDGKTYSRFDAFVAEVGNRKAHGLTKDIVPGDGVGKGLKALASADDSDDKADEIEARVKKALGMTDVGRAALNIAK